MPAFSSMVGVNRSALNKESKQQQTITDRCSQELFCLMLLFVLLVLSLRCPRLYSHLQCISVTQKFCFRNAVFFKNVCHPRNSSVLETESPTALLRYCFMLNSRTLYGRIASVYNFCGRQLTSVFRKLYFQRFLIILEFHKLLVMSVALSWVTNIRKQGMFLKPVALSEHVLILITLNGVLHFS